MKRITIILAALGAVAAMLVPTASVAGHGGSGLQYKGKPAASFYTQAALDAWGQRMQAQARHYLRQYAGKPAASFYTQAALDAWGQRMQAQARHYLTREPGVGS